MLPLAADFRRLILAFHKSASFRGKNRNLENNHEMARVKAR
jgi:hypothetical protein